MVEPNIHVLLVDDDELTNQIHETIIRIWSQGQVSIESYLKAEKVLNLLRESLQEQKPLKPDFIFLDINMPEMNGWEFLEKYEQLGLSIPVYVLSSSIQSKDKERATSHLSVRGYITKPLSPETLNQLGLFNEVQE